MAMFRGIVALVLFLAIFDLSISKKVHIKREIKPLSNRVADIVARDIGIQNNPPFLQADEYHIREDANLRCFNVLSNDKDLEHNLDRNSLEIVTLPSNGVAVAYNDTACYKPDANFHGWDSFEYSVCDKKDNCAWALVRINVLPINDAPLVRNDTAVVEEDEWSITIDVLRNDEDVDGAYVDYSTFAIVQAPQNGVAVVTSDHKVVYTPTYNDKVRFYGEDYFIYQICDNENPTLCSYGTVSVEVLDKCIACFKCKDYIPTFNDHKNWLYGYFRKDVLENVYVRHNVLHPGN